MDITAEKLAQVILDTARLQHEGYDQEGARKAQRESETEPLLTHPGVDYAKFYRKKLDECAREACLLNDVDLRFAYLVYVSLTTGWNDVLGWAAGVQQGLAWDKL